MDTTRAARQRRLLAEGLVFPEGPRWRGDRLWFSDMYAGEVWTIDLQGRTERIARFDDHTAGLGFLPDGDLLVVLKQTQRIMRIGGAGIEQHADLRPLGGNHLNDMVVDEAGRAYVDVRINPPNYSQLPAETTEAAEDFIVCVAPSGGWDVVARGLLTPNGLAIGPTGTRFVVAETRGCRLTEYRRDPATGGLNGGRVLADLAGVRPDGICLDSEGAVWIGSPNTAQFVRVLPSGAIAESIATPGKLALACALGGPERRTLFLMTAITTPQELAQDRAKGFVEVTQVEVPGAGIP
ncbi:MAG: SMP-30/gluconolactonase/LRE family protein [Nevskiales bacterium]